MNAAFGSSIKYDANIPKPVDITATACFLLSRCKEYYRKQQQNRTTHSS
jgi:hypothetical protein